MGYRFQFRKLLGEKVMIEDRRVERKYKGVLVGEDRWFLYVENAVIENAGKVTRTPMLSLHKSRVGLIEKLQEAE